MRRSVPVAAMAALSGCLGSCGGGGGSTQPTVVSTPTPAPVPTVVAQGSIEIGAPDDEFTYFHWVTFTTTAAGRLETTVNWTFASNTVFMYIAEGDCTDDKFANVDCPGGPTCECRFSAQSETTGPKPRVLTVSSAAPGLRTLIAWNLGPREEALSYQVVLTTSIGSSAPLVQQSISRAGRPLAKRSVRHR